MDTEMEDIHNIVDPSVHKGLEYNDMENEGLEEGELIDGRPQIPSFKAFNIATSEAKDKANRLAKVEIWEETMNREKTRKHLMESVEGAACTRKAQTEVPLVSSTSPPLPQDSMHNTPRQGSMDSEMSGWTEEERDQTIHNGMYGNAYVDICGDVYWDTNVDIHEENLVSENLSRTRRKKSNRGKQRKKAAELQASLRIHGLLPVPSQALQEQSDRTFSQRDAAALRPKSNNNQLELREQEGSRDMAMGRTNPGMFTLQQERLEKIANLRERIMERKTLLQAQDLLPLSPSRQNLKENSIRTLPDGNLEANIFKPHNVQEKENRQETLEIMEIENIDSVASPQKRDPSQHVTKSLKSYQVRLREQRDKMRAQTQQSALDRQKSYGMAASPAQIAQNLPTIIRRSHENDVATPIQQEKNTTVEREREPSTSIPGETRVLLQREKERRQRLSALDNVELVEKRKEEQEQETSECACQDLRCLGEDKFGNGEKSFSIPQNIGDMSDDARWHGTKIGEVMQETPLISGAMVENTSKDIWSGSIPEVLSQLFYLSEEVEEIIKMENEWFGWLGIDTDIDQDIEDFINVTAPSLNTTIEHPSEPEDTGVTPDILSELFNISEDIDVQDSADVFAGC
ncbi:hypothetical protein BHYA_0039g00190 [Botrytis hyacinthi]|uniref:Uncharacterized protein n=1 Tax=Botrytis hyacinthi TaxID=278943 RepID=A0A4Z1GV17_9HELO|nr:hypothetical protein BHYA_0039g00190 [Botrytis hyacinthi]